jgi:hypothetical protein
MDRIFGASKPKKPTAGQAMRQVESRLAEVRERTATLQQNLAASRARSEKIRSDFVAKYGYDPIGGKK